MDGWGLVLAGGGGKGSYQMGVWKYLCEQGYDQMFRAFAGTSVGALNAALFAQGDPKRAEAVWLSITQEQILSDKDAEEAKRELAEAQNGDPKALKRLRSAVKLLAGATIAPGILGAAGMKKLAGWVSARLNEGIFSPSGLAQLIEENIDDSRISGSSVPCYVTCCSDGLKRKANYIELSGQSSGEQVKAYLLASSAIPAIFPAVTVDGQTYCDGGLRDNVPLKPLYEQTGIRNFLVVHLSPKSSLDVRKFPDVRIVQLNPSKDLGNLFDGTLNFDPATMKQNIDLGYQDMEKALSRIL